jgi:hypothetical protein
MIKRGQNKVQNFSLESKKEYQIRTDELGRKTQKARLE